MKYKYSDQVNKLPTIIFYQKVIKFFYILNEIKITKAIISTK